MTRWYRAYVGTCTDPKIAAVAFACKVPKTTVIAMWHFILEQAADARNGGRVTLDKDLFCGALEISADDVKNIWAAMIGRDMVTGDEVVNWKKRQYETDLTDATNAERQKKWRQKHKRNSNGTVTERKRPDTDTDTYKNIEGKSKRAGTKVPFPDGWIPKTESVEKGKALGFTPREVGVEAQKFKAKSLASDWRYVRWDSAFDNWLINAAGYQNKSPPTKSVAGFRADPNTPEFNAWRAYAKDFNKQSLARILDQREMEGRQFEFESQWPPGHRVTINGE